MELWEEMHSAFVALIFIGPEGGNGVSVRFTGRAKLLSTFLEEKQRDIHCWLAACYV